MSYQSCTQPNRQQRTQGPFITASPFYRLLQLLARFVAQRLESSKSSEICCVNASEGHRRIRRERLTLIANSGAILSGAAGERVLSRCGFSASPISHWLAARTRRLVDTTASIIVLPSLKKHDLVAYSFVGAPSFECGRIVRPLQARQVEVIVE